MSNIIEFGKYSERKTTNFMNRFSSDELKLLKSLEEEQTKLYHKISLKLSNEIDLSDAEHVRYFELCSTILKMYHSKQTDEEREQMIKMMEDGQKADLVRTNALLQKLPTEDAPAQMHAYVNHLIRLIDAIDTTTDFKCQKTYFEELSDWHLEVWDLIYDNFVPPFFKKTKDYSMFIEHDKTNIKEICNVAKITLVQWKVSIDEKNYDMFLDRRLDFHVYFAELAHIFW